MSEQLKQEMKHVLYLSGMAEHQAAAIVEAIGMAMSEFCCDCGTKLYALKESSDEIALPEIKQRATTKMRVGKVKNLESSDEQTS